VFGEGRPELRDFDHGDCKGYAEDAEKAREALRIERRRREGIQQENQVDSADRQLGSSHTLPPKIVHILTSPSPPASHWFHYASQFVNNGGPYNDHALAAFLRGFRSVFDDLPHDNGGAESVDSHTISSHLPHSSLSPLLSAILNCGLILSSVSSPPSLLAMRSAYLGVVNLSSQEHPMIKLQAKVRMATNVPVITTNEFNHEIFREEMERDMDMLGKRLLSEDGANVDPNDIDAVDLMSATLFHLSHQGGGGDADKRLMEVFRQMFHRIKPSGWGDPVNDRDTFSDIKTDVVEEKQSRPEKKILIGFISTLLTDHSIGRIMTPLISRLAEIARSTDSVEIVLITPQHPEGSNPSSPIGEEPTLLELTSASSDPVIRHLGSLVHSSVRLPHDRTIATQQAFFDSLDLSISVFTDVGMAPETFFLPQYVRTAKKVVAWWGHPSTTGISGNLGNVHVDYWFGLDIESPEAALTQYSEQLVRMSRMNFAPFAIRRDGLEREVSSVFDVLGSGALHAVSTNGCTQGDEKIYMVLGRAFKLHPNFEDMLYDILARDPCGIVVLVGERQVSWNKLARLRIDNPIHRPDVTQNILRRIQTINYWNYVRVLSLATIVLDTSPYGGCLTVQESISSGRVVVTMKDPFARGQFAAAVYGELNEASPTGWRDWPVAEDKDGFVNLAVELANDDERRGNIAEAAFQAWENMDEGAVGDEWWAALMKIAGTE